MFPAVRRVDRRKVNRVDWDKNMMNEKILEEFAKQEKEDQTRMTICFETAVREELERPERYLHLLKGKDYPPKEILKLSVKETPIRVSSEISIRKHTMCQIPYYHTHDFYELIYVYRGTGGQYLAGEKEELRMEAGDVCLLTPGKIHAMMPSGEKDIVLKLILPRTAVKDLMSEFRTDGSLSGWADMLGRRNELYLYRAAAISAFPVRHLIEALMMELYREEGSAKTAVKSLLSLLMIGLERSKPAGRDSSFLYTVVNYIQNNICTAELDGLAAWIGYSSRHLTRRIADETGSSFSDLLVHIRLQKAADLLAETELTVEEVACRTGYKNSSGLYKRFQAVYGMSPGEYRKLYRC